MTSQGASMQPREPDGDRKETQRRISARRLRPIETIDWFKRVIDVATLVVIILGLYFAWDQATQFNRGQNLANWSDVVARTFDVDKVFVDSPDMLKYFTDGVDLKKTDKDYAKANAIALMTLDYFDSVMTRLEYNRGHLSDDILQQGAWNHYFEGAFAASPILCRTLMADPASYGKEMRKLGPAACKQAFPAR